MSTEYNKEIVRRYRAAHTTNELVRCTLCQAQLLDQFSVWVPPLTLTKRLTSGQRARAGRSVPPAPKKSSGAAREPYPR